MATPGKYDKCEALGAFNEMIQRMFSEYNKLGPDNREFSNLFYTDKKLNTTGMEFIRGAIVAVMSVWETYVHDLFQEAFQVVIDSTLERKKSLSHLEKQWPACSAIIKKEMKREAEKSYDGQVEDLAYELLKSEQSDLRRDGEQIAWRSERNDPRSDGNLTTWRELLDAHCDRVLQEPVLPIFGTIDNATTIDGLFQKLFGEKKSVSEVVVTVGKFHYDIREKYFDNVFVLADSEAVKGCPELDALHTVSRLFYGLRCALVHGKHEEILKGVLKDFPADVDNFPLPPENNNDVKEFYVEIYWRIKSYGRDIHMSYLTLISLERFFRSAAIYLKRAIAKWFYDIQPNDSEKVCIWKYKPQVQWTVSDILT